MDFSRTASYVAVWAGEDMTWRLGYSIPGWAG
ncbi:hypothetical protein SAMN05421538_10556 [Paracoccus isoporae]|uniref:Uncharacterized protein n=1 Tax=Paracoccus isoporae TaxID=591205 RepID=A0A1G7BCW4_9RHOB|nr:hypothetical protein SAMN05421538_10556 [Paracoccus isoporae]